MAYDKGGQASDTAGCLEWPCFVYYVLPDERPELRYQGVGYKRERNKDDPPDDDTGFLITHAASPEELAGRMKAFVKGMTRRQNRPLSGAYLHTRWEPLSHAEEKRFLDKLGLNGKK